jgi:hypothetical protein
LPSWARSAWVRLGDEAIRRFFERRDAEKDEDLEKKAALLTAAWEDDLALFVDTARDRCRSGLGTGHYTKQAEMRAGFQPDRW